MIRRNTPAKTSMANAGNHGKSPCLIGDTSSYMVVFDHCHLSFSVHSFLVDCLRCGFRPICCLLALITQNEIFMSYSVQYLGNQMLMNV